MVLMTRSHLPRGGQDALLRSELPSLPEARIPAQNCGGISGLSIGTHLSNQPDEATMHAWGRRVIAQVEVGDMEQVIVVDKS